MTRTGRPGRLADCPECYPAALECDVRTTDGSVLSLRPIRPDDGQRLTEFHNRLSPRSVYRRFFNLHLTLDESEVERFTHVDYVDRLALVVEDGGQLVAVARYERLPSGNEAEVAFVVADRYQHRGLGSLLLDHLADAARDRGIEAFVAETLPDNQDMLDVFAGSGFPISTGWENGTVRVRFAIQPDVRYRRARAGREHAEAEGPSSGTEPPG